jgi:3-hydroxyisobutyrate dehydrogenase
MTEIGFIGLGLMGEPMARALARSGRALRVWNRSRERCLPLRGLGARVASSPDEVFEHCEVVLLMLGGAEAVDEVLGRGTPRFTAVRDHVVVPMGTTSPSYSEGLASAVAAVGGRHVEAPVSGSRVPAEHGELLMMFGGDDDVIDVVEPMLAPMYRRAVRCGPAPRALLMKLAVNTFLITTVVGLVEAHHFAESHALDLAVFHDVVGHGQVASEISAIKAAKLLADDRAAQAAAGDVWRNCRLITETAMRDDLELPLIDVCTSLYADTVAQGHGFEDMIAVIDAVRGRAHRR